MSPRKSEPVLYAWRGRKRKWSRLCGRKLSRAFSQHERAVLKLRGTCIWLGRHITEDPPSLSLCSNTTPKWNTLEPQGACSFIFQAPRCRQWPATACEISTVRCRGGFGNYPCRVRMTANKSPNKPASRWLLRLENHTIPPPYLETSYGQGPAVPAYGLRGHEGARPRLHFYAARLLPNFRGRDGWP